MSGRRRLVTALGLTLALVLGMVGAFARPSHAQVGAGATMTVLRGQVAVIRTDGSAIQPAPSGTVVGVGDEIRTLTKAGALITFFAGTEVEMGEETNLVVEEIDRTGDRINVSLRQVLGTSLHRVQTIAGSDSLYRVEAGGAVALVRGTTFAVLGPYPSSVGNLVILVCLEDCDPSSTFAECELVPETAFGVVVDRGKVLSRCERFAAKPADGYFGAGDQALTSFTQMLGGNGGGGDGGKDPDDTQNGTEDRPNGPPSNSDDDDDDCSQVKLLPNGVDAVLAAC